MQLLGWEAGFFFILAVMILFMGVFTVSARNAVHSALFLISTLIGVAGLFLLLHAEFITGVQILVYVGAVMVLFLFVVMLVSSRDEPVNMYSRQYVLATILSGLLGAGIMVSAYKSNGFFKTHSEVTQTAGRDDPNAPSGRISSDTEQLGQELYTTAVLPFEIASLVLLVAMIGAVLLARDRKQEEMYN